MAEKVGNEFYSPFQFIRATGQLNGHPSARTDFDDILNGKSSIRHDRWEGGAYSGELVATVTTCSPLFIGATHHGSPSDEQAQTVEPYTHTINQQQVPAIPGNSLRGVISSYMETVSQSALRVLDDRHLSVRKPMPRKNQPPGTEGPLLGLGIVVSSTTDQATYELLPLCVSGGLLRNGQNGLENNGDGCWLELFADRPLSHCLPVYVDGYNKRNYQTGFLQSEKPQAYPYPDDQSFYYARLNPVLDSITADSDFFWSDDLQRALIVLGNTGPVLAQEALPDKSTGKPDIINAQEYQRLTDDEQAEYTRGVLRVLDMDNYRDVIPASKNREFFLPYPEDADIKAVTIPQTVQDTYTTLWEDSLQADKNERLPVRLNGYPDVRIGEGRIFCFAAQAQEEEPDVQSVTEAKTAEAFGGLEAMIAAVAERQEKEKDEPPPKKNYSFTITEISQSSLWRKMLPDTVHDFFPEHLRPWHDDKQEQQKRKLTPAETLFGFVSEGKSTQDSAGAASALAGRLYFNDAVPVTTFERADDYFLKQETLKILSSPKPPAPAMYFHKKPGSDADPDIDKTTLNKEKHQANGYKHYLHHPKACSGDKNYQPWITKYPEENLKQKVSIRPVKAAVCFRFTVRFENLCAAELDWLLTALHPGDGYYHHMGMGKPFGLGSVQFAVAGVYLTDRAQRYRVSELSRPRFHQAWINPQFANLPGQPDYQADAISDFMTARQQLKETVLEADSLIDQDSYQALRHVMSPDRLQADILINYPLLEQQDDESKGFQWFVANSKVDRKQALGSVGKISGVKPLYKLPTNSK